LFVLEDLGLDLGETNLDCLSFHDFIGYLNERKQALLFKSLNLPFGSECSKSPEEWKRSIAAGPDFDLGPHGLLEAKLNLGDYLITLAMFCKDWLSRFIKVDPEHKRSWTVNPLKARWGKGVREIIEHHNIGVVETYGTDQDVKIRFQRFFHVIRDKLQRMLHTRGTVPSARDRGYLALKSLASLKHVLPVSSSHFVSDRAFDGKGPPSSTSSLANLGIWFSLKNGQVV